MLFHSHISEGEFLQLQPERLPLNSCGFQAWRWLASTEDFTESPAETNKGAGQRNVWFHRTTAERMWWETSTELSTEFSLIGVTLCSRLKHVHSHCWRVSSIFSVILMTHVSVFRLSRVEPECLPCLTYGGLFPERVGPVCLSVCLWLGGRASQETAHKHTDTHRVFVSCLNKGGRWGFVAAGGSVVLIRPSVSSPCRIPVSVIESRSETTTSNRPHNNTLIEISPETILRVVSIETESLCVFVQGNIFILGVHSRSCPWLTLSNWILVYLTGHPGRSHSRASQVSFSVLCFKHDLRTLKRPHCRSHWCHMACTFQLNTQNLKIS